MGAQCRRGKERMIPPHRERLAHARLWQRFVHRSPIANQHEPIRARLIAIEIGEAGADPDEASR